MSCIGHLGVVAGAFAALAVAQPSLAQQPATPPAAAAAEPAPTAIGSASYVLGIGDSLRVSVLGRSDYDVRARVSTDGAVYLPYLGAVPATGRSTAQLADDIRAALEKGGYFADPTVHVELLDVASKYVTVLGYVGTRGLLPLDRDYRLSEVMARVGGRGDGGADYVILTHDNGQQEQFDIAQLATATRDKDPIVQAGDRIYVPAATADVFYMTGAVKQAGAFPVTNGLTLRTALAKAGGVSENGSDKKIKITREGKTLKDVKLDETIVQPGDIIEVGERLF